jgi:hypothetical protein
LKGHPFTSSHFTPALWRFAAWLWGLLFDLQTQLVSQYFAADFFDSPGLKGVELEWSVRNPD